MLEIDTIDLTEILNRAENGMSAPFICRCSDGEIYYVKSRETVGYNALCSEMIAACIANDWGLPIPICRFIRVDSELLRYSERSDVGELKTSPVWGVQEVPKITIYTENQRRYLDDELCQKILLFDWFIKNEDRKTGNPNLLWDFTSRKLTVIDHNNAFDSGFDLEAFCREHVFRDDRKEIQKNRFEKLIKESILHLDEYFSLLPDEWQDEVFIDEYRKRVTEYLQIPIQEPEKFWSMR